MPRENFNSEVKKKLAQRAGFRCSICNCLTVGPSTESEDSVNLTGVAAHISAASPGGRRFSDLPVNSAERSTINNGIWLCANHADLIDGDETFFTSSLLKTYKAKHEEKINFEHKGLKNDSGSVVSIKISNLGLIRNEVTLEFGNKNLILGTNGVGKTLVCELIASLKNKQYLNRWHKYTWDETNGYSYINYYKNETIKFGIFINSDNKISYSFNDVAQPFLNAPFSVFLLTKNIYDFKQDINVERENRNELPIEETDIITWLSQYFNLTEEEFVNVINSMRNEEKFFVNDIRIKRKRRSLEVMFWGRSNDSFHPFHEFSGGERQRIVLEIALKIASYYAKFQTTILLLENSAISTIDQTGINKLLDVIDKNDLGFQFFFTSFQKPDYFRAPNFVVQELIECRKLGGITSDKGVTVVKH